MKVLFVVPYAPTRIRTRPFHLIRALQAAGHEVTVGTLWANAEDRAVVDELARVGPVLAEPLPAFRSLWNCACSLPKGDPMQAHFSWSARLADRLARAVEEGAFDVVHVEHLRGVRYGLRLGEWLKDRRHRPALVWDSVDCISSLFRRASRESLAGRVRMVAGFELPRTERYEGAAVSRFDRVLVTAETDRRDLEALALAADRTRPPRIDVVPNGVDLDYFTPPSAPREPMTLVLTGKMSYHANATAVSRFVRDVMPRVWAQLPAVRVWVAGKDPTAEVSRLGRPWNGSFPEGPGDGSARSQVAITGTVPDLRPFLRSATLAVAPIQYGVGIQNKVLEAMACATPVVATREAAAGLADGADDAIAVASSAEELARSLVALLRDPERRAKLGEAGRVFVERRHSWSAVGTRLSDIYRHARP